MLRVGVKGEKQSNTVVLVGLAVGVGVAVGLAVGVGVAIQASPSTP